MKIYFNHTKPMMLAALLSMPALGWTEAGGKSLFMHIDDGETLPEVKKVIPTAAKSKTKAKTISHKHPDDTSKPHISANASPTKTKPASLKVSYAGLQYWIDLVAADGGSRRVTTGHTFHSGDRIRLRIKSKSAGYLYVENQDVSGEKTRLYPVNGQEAQLLEPGVTYSIPANGSIRFDDVSGNEKITIALAKQPIMSSGSSTAIADPARNVGQTMYAACNHSDTGSKGLFVEASSPNMDCIRKNYAAGSKGLFSEEDTTSPEPASYAVLPESTLDEGKVMIVDFKLIHH